MPPGVKVGGEGETGQRLDLVGEAGLVSAAGGGGRPEALHHRPDDVVVAAGPGAAVAGVVRAGVGDAVRLDGAFRMTDWAWLPPAMPNSTANDSPVPSSVWSSWPAMLSLPWTK